MGDQAGPEGNPQDGTTEGEGQSGREVTLNRFFDYSIWMMVIFGGTVAAYYPVLKDINEHASSFYFYVCRSLLFLAFLDDFVLLLLAIHLLRGFSERLYITAKVLIYTAVTLMMLTSTSFLLLLNRSYAMVTILVLPVMAIVIIVFYNGVNTDLAREFTDYEAHQPELKRFFDLSAKVTVAAFGGMIATIFGYFKNFPKVDVDFKFSEAFIFFTVNSGLLVMLLTTVPPSLPYPNARSRYIDFIKVLVYFLFGLLALIGLAVAAEFLGQLILLAFLPMFLAIVVWFRKEFIQKDGTSQAPSATGHQSEPDTSAITITAFVFAALMAVYSVYFGSEDNDIQLKTCMFLLSLAFMSSLSWMILAFIRPRTQSLEMSVMILTYLTFVWLVFAMLDLIFLVILTDYRK